MPYKYRPIDWNKREIRVLSFAEPDDAKSSSVHCSLGNVLLDDFAPEFAEHLAKGLGSSCSPTATASWLKLHKTGSLMQPESRSGVISLPVWRRDAGIMKWEHLAGSLGIDTSALFRLSGDVQTYTNINQSTTISTDPRDNVFDLRTRFNWGDFEAVSYCWKSEVRERNVIIDGSPYMVPKSVDTVLRRLRDLPEAKSGMKFWIDAICVDQDNIREKNHQVNLMGEIYATAFSTVVWLGESMDGSERAMEYMIQIMHVKKEISRRVDNFSWPWEESTSDEWFAAVPWHAIYSFLGRRYWTRLWIIQELALNHNATLFLCGNRQLTREVIALATRFCTEGETPGKIGSIIDGVSRYGPIATGKADFFSAARRVDSLVWLDALSSPAKNLDQVLDLGQRAESTDPRDKVYGLLGLFPEGLRARIQPDYSRTASQDDVYRRLCEAVLMHTSRVDSMLSWCYFREESSLPSWIPDWTAKFPRNHVKWLKEKTASLDTASALSISANGRHLFCKGIVVDAINELSFSLSENIPYGTAMARCGPTHRYGNGNLGEALQRTLVNGHPRGCQGNSTALLESIFWVDWNVDGRAGRDDQQILQLSAHMQIITENAKWQDFDRFRQMNANFSIFGIRFRDFFPAMSSYTPSFPWGPAYGTAPITPDTTAIMALAVISIWARRLATTQTGFLGLVPAETRQGDVIAIIYGCNFPVVLRPGGHGFKVVGECYIDGLMGGEAMDAMNRGEYEETELMLY